MERKEKGRYFLKTKIRTLIDDIYCPTKETLSFEFNFDYISRLSGAVWYAFEIGDIDKTERRLFLDQLNEIRRIVLRNKKHADLSALNGDVTEGKVETRKGKGEKDECEVSSAGIS